MAYSVAPAAPVAQSADWGEAPGRRKSPWWRRLLTFDGPSPEIAHAVLERLLALLEAARGDLEAGWLQDGWHATSAPGGQQILTTGLAAGLSARQPASAVCLVAALIRAGVRQGGDAETGRAIDVVHDALWESRGQSVRATPGPGLFPVSSPQVRQAKVQELTRWNDARDRTGSEVIAVLDGAIARVIQDLAALPAPPRVPAGAPA
jgi:hypothetical protein